MIETCSYQDNECKYYISSFLVYYWRINENFFSYPILYIYCDKIMYTKKHFLLSNHYWDVNLWPTANNIWNKNATKKNILQTTETYSHWEGEY